MLTQRERLILLNMTAEIGPIRLHRLLAAFGDLDRLWGASFHELQRVEGIGPAFAQHLLDAFAGEPRLRKELALAERSRVRIVTLGEDGYPRPLTTLPDPPLALYVSGTLDASDGVAVAIVGARHASAYGLQCAERLAYDLAIRGVTVVSGLARGVDGAAHRGAMKTPGRTLAVLGSGLGRIYPPEHEELARRIAGQGAVISEYPMEMSPMSHLFPRRNRLISGLALGVVVVEASPTSGALITAGCALEQGREVFAVPGPITGVGFQGAHRLLKDGARLVTSVEDVLDELRLTEHTSAQAAPAEEELADLGLPELERRVATCLRADRPTPIDDVIAQSGLRSSEASSALLQLELKRLIRQLPGKQFIKSTRDGVDDQRRAA